jgi:hypothetical protein
MKEEFARMEAQTVTGANARLLVAANKRIAGNPWLLPTQCMFPPQRDTAFPPHIPPQCDGALPSIRR